MKISFHLHVSESLFSYETITTRTRFGKEAKGNSEMAYLCPTVAEENLPTISGIDMHQLAWQYFAWGKPPLPIYVLGCRITDAFSLRADGLEGYI